MNLTQAATVFIPGKLVNPLNNRRGWRAVWASSKAWREKTALYAKLGMPSLTSDPHAPKRITFRAHVWRLFDTDEGLNASIKPIRDGLTRATVTGRRVRGQVKLVSAPGAGIIHSDGPGCGHLFVYEQIVDRRRLGVEIIVQALAEIIPAGVAR